MYRQRHVYGRSVRARPARTPVYVARAAASRAARSARIAAYREAPFLSNLAVRGLNLQPGEFKSVDANAVLDVNTAGAVFLLNGIARGDDIDERIGRQVTLKSIQMRAQTYGTAGTGVDQTHRVMIVYDRQTNAAALTVADVLQTVAWLSHRNLENRKRFRVLYDKCVNINATGEPGTSRVLEFYRHLNHPEEFNNGDAGTVADIQSGSLYLVVIGSEAAGATAGSINVYTRVRYVDQ